MKRLFFLILPVVLLGNGLTLAENEPASDRGVRIASVDMQELLRQFPRAQEFQNESNQLRARIQKEDNERRSAIRKLEESAQDLRKQLDDPTVNSSKKQTLFQQLQTAQQEALALERERTDHFQRRLRALNERTVSKLKELLSHIRMIVTEFAKEADYDYVFDSSGLSASQVPLLIYSKDATDITASVLKRLGTSSAGEKSGIEPRPEDAHSKTTDP